MTELMCADCGERPAHYKRDGLRCGPCWKRWKRNTDPEWAEQARATSRRWKAEHQERRREYDRQYSGSGRCERCSGRCARSSTICQACLTAEWQQRRTTIERMWREGEPTTAIAEALGTTVNSMNVTIARMRRYGWDLPYRYRMENGRRVA